MHQSELKHVLVQRQDEVEPKVGGIKHESRYAVIELEGVGKLLQCSADSIEYFNVLDLVQNFSHHLVVFAHPVVERLDPFALEIAFSSGNKYFDRDQTQKQDHETRIEVERNVCRKRNVPNGAEQNRKNNCNSLNFVDVVHDAAEKYARRAGVEKPHLLHHERIKHFAAQPALELFDKVNVANFFEKDPKMLEDFDVRFVQNERLNARKAFEIRWDVGRKPFKCDA